MNEMINASTVLLPLLTIEEKNSVYLNFSILLFSILGCASHVFPKNSKKYNPYIKMLLSNLLFALVDVNPFSVLILSFVDLIPLYSTNKILKKIGKIIVIIPRLGIEFYFYKELYEKHFYDVLIMITCRVIYFLVVLYKKGRSKNLGFLYSIEYIGLYILLKDLSEIPFNFLTYFIILSVLFILYWKIFQNSKEILNDKIKSQESETVKNSSKIIENFLKETPRRKKKI